MTTNELASLLANHTGPVTDQALRQLAVSVKDVYDWQRLPPRVRAALRAVEQAVKVEAGE